MVHLDVRHEASREMIGGILRYSAIHRSWEVQFAAAHPDNNPLSDYESWRPDALIIDAACHCYGHKTFRNLSGRAVVYVNTEPRKHTDLPHACIVTDDEALAKAAAALFLRKGLRNFAYVGAPEPIKYSIARERFFRETLGKNGFAVSTFPTPKAGPRHWLDRQAALAKWLHRLPKPCGVWVAYDQRAKQVLDACRAGGIPVPEQIQVLGVDDEAYICEQTVPSLSSVAPDFENGGFRAMEFIDRALDHPEQANSPNRLLFESRGIVERLSTADVNGTARRVAAAYEFIRRHAQSDIGVGDIAMSLGVSTRLLQKNYRMVKGRTLIEDLQDERLARVRRMLRRTTTPIDAIGQFCGFKSTSHLKTLFRRRFGMTMGEFRATGKVAT